MTVERKLVGATIKQAGDDGTFEAVIATFDEIDRDRDIVAPGAFGGATASVLPAHDDEHVPLGKTTIVEVGKKAVAKGRFNTEIAAARDWHSALKFDLANPPAVQEWSWGFRPLEFRFEEHDGERVRVLEKIDLREVSPVLRGASIGTRTLSVKRLKAEGLSDNDRREVLERALMDAEKNAEYVWVEAVFDDVVVYNVRRGDEASRTFERGYKMTSETEATIEPQRVEVVRDVSYRPRGGSGKDAPRLKLADELRIVTADVGGAIARVLEVAHRRKAEGRELGDTVAGAALDMAHETRELELLIKGLQNVAREILPTDAVAAAAARFLATEARRRGVLD